MEKEKIEKIQQGLKCCGNKMPLATCGNCPYTNTGNCTVNLLSDCGELVAELLGVEQ